MSGNLWFRFAHLSLLGFITLAILFGCQKSSSDGNGSDLQNGEGLASGQQYSPPEGGGSSATGTLNPTLPAPDVSVDGSGTSALPRIGDSRFSPWFTGDSSSVANPLYGWEHFGPVDPQKFAAVAAAVAASYCTVANAPGIANVFDVLNAFYWDILGRPADAQGLLSHAQALNPYDEASRTARALAFFQSDEYHKNMIRSYLRHFVPAAGTAFNNALLADKRDLRTVLIRILNSRPFWARAGYRPRRFVINLYVLLLGRPRSAVSEDEIRNWVQVFSSQGKLAVVRGFVTSEEYRRRVVTGYYHTLLGRNPEEGGLAGWASALNSQTFEQVGSQIAGSQEYFDKAGRRFSPPRLTVHCP